MSKLLLFLLVLTACAPVPPKTVARIDFPLEEYEALPRTGTSTVTGRAYAKTPQGEIYYPNEYVRLNPKTSYSQQWYEINYIGANNIGPADKRYFDYIYKTKVDAEGRFIFKNIPAGTYYLSAPIYWSKMIPNNDGSVSLTGFGGFICHEINIEKGQVLAMNITNKTL